MLSSCAPLRFNRVKINYFADFCSAIMYSHSIFMVGRGSNLRLVFLCERQAAMMNPPPPFRVYLKNFLSLEIALRLRSLIVFCGTPMSSDNCLSVKSSK